MEGHSGRLQAEREGIVNALLSDLAANCLLMRTRRAVLMRREKEEEEGGWKEERGTLARGCSPSFRVPNEYE